MKRKTFHFFITSLALLCLILSSRALAQDFNSSSDEGSRILSQEISLADLDTSPLAKLNEIELRGGIHFSLPSTPDDPDLNRQFKSLSLEERARFYRRRKFVLKALISAVAFPRLIGGAALAKSKLKQISNAILRSDSPLDELVEAESESPEAAIDGQTLRERGEAVLTTLVNGFVDSMWKRSVFLARASSMGFTIVAGVVANASLHKWGALWARTLTVDFGIDFAKKKAYVILTRDRHQLTKPGFSFDVGSVIDVLIHFRNDPAPGESTAMTLENSKMIPIGLARSGKNYQAYGFNFGWDFIEVAALILPFYGYTAEGLSIAGAMQVIGFLSTYSSSIERGPSKKWTPSIHWMNRWIRKDRTLNQCVDLFS